ncbi:hypothetical protein EMCRGX_G006734 [Ephydatia muelleri]
MRAVAPAEALASSRLAGVRGEDTVTSKAAGRPLCSPEQECQLDGSLNDLGIAHVPFPIALKADILVTNWDNGISAAFDVTVASPLNSSTITEAGMYSGAAARAAELRKHTQNDSKCAELSWKCIPLAVECYSAWGPEALKAFSQVATRLAIRENTSKSMALTDLFGRLSHSLIRANARAILSRSYSHLLQQVDEL